MAKCKLVVAFVFIFLFAFSGEVPAGSWDKPGSQQTFRCIIASNGTLKSAAAVNFHFTKAATVKTHLKTRYMGGDCTYDICPNSFQCRAAVFGDKTASIAADFSVHSHERFLLSLRGPPPCVIAWA